MDNLSISVTSTPDGKMQYHLLGSMVEGGENYTADWDT